VLREAWIEPRMVARAIFHKAPDFLANAQAKFGVCIFV